MIVEASKKYPKRLRCF